MYCQVQGSHARYLGCQLGARPSYFSGPIPFDELKRDCFRIISDPDTHEEVQNLESVKVIIIVDFNIRLEPHQDFRADGMVNECWSEKVAAKIKGQVNCQAMRLG